MALNKAYTLVIGSGNYFTGPVGTALPAALNNVGTPWENMGHTSLEDILALSSEGGEPTVLGTLQSKSLRTTYSARSETFSIILQQFDEASLRLYYGANATLGEQGELQVPANNPAPTKAAFLAVFYDGDNAFAFYAPEAEIFRGDDMELSDTESLAGLPLSVKPLQMGTNNWAYAVTPIKEVTAPVGTP